MKGRGLGNPHYHTFSTFEVLGDLTAGLDQRGPAGRMLGDGGDATVLAACGS